MQKLLSLAAVAVALAGCNLLVDADQGCDPETAPCQKPGFVCTADRVCVPGGSSSGSSGSGSSGSSGASSGSSGSTGGSGGSTGGAEMTVAGADLYGANSFFCQPSAGGAPVFYLLGGSVGAPFPTSGGPNLQPGIEQVGASASGDEVSLTDAGRLTSARREAVLADFGDEVFVLGGEDRAPNQSPSNDELVSLGASCALTVRSIPPVLADARSAAAVAVSAPFAYVLGGLNRADGGVLDDVQVLQRFDDGGLGQVRAIPGALRDGRAYQRAVRVQNRLFVLGGITASSGGVATSAIESAPLFDDGGIGAFADAGSLAVARAEPAAFVVNGAHLLVAGGMQKAQLPGQSGPPPPAALDDVETCDLATGTCQAYDTQAHLLTARAGFEAQPSGPGVLLLVGGITGAGASLTGTDTVEQLPLPTAP